MRTKSERPASNNGRKVATFGSDERCTEPGCTTYLSRYNPTTLCASHQERRARSAT